MRKSLFISEGKSRAFKKSAFQAGLLGAQEHAHAAGIKVCLDKVL